MDLVVDNLETALLASPPPGTDAAYIRHFFARNREALIALVGELVEEARRAGKVIDLPAPAPARDVIDPNARARANILAMQLLARGGPFSGAERTSIARYSGWGGVGLRKWASQFPAGFPVPEERGLVHEYYTPTRLWEACATTVYHRFQMPLEEDGSVSALEPSAGIGRALRGFENLPVPIRWTALEASAVSVRLLRALFPGAEVFEGFAERWIAANLGRRFGLIAANPPYGPRGEAPELDPGGYRTAQAYLYFVIRTAELLARGGIGVQIIPTGLMTSRTPAFVRHRTELLRRAHLLAAFRLPSEPPPGGTREDVAYENFVVDVLFLKGRGGIAATPPASDGAILAGDYFDSVAPGHVLGEVRVDSEDEEGAPNPRVRRGMQIVGKFAGFPDFTPRVMEDMPVARGDVRIRTRGGIGRDLTAGALSPDAGAALLGAEALGLRADRHLEAVARGDVRGASGGPELIRDFGFWRTSYGDPSTDAALSAAASAGNVGIRRFLTVWAGGTPSATLGATVQPAGYHGPISLLGLADWTYRQRGGMPLPVDVLSDAAQDLGLGAVGDDRVRAELFEAGWRLDPPRPDPERRTVTIEPRDAYLTGFLWPKYDRAKGPAEVGDAFAQRQLDELRAAIGWTGGSQLVKESGPQQSWIPLDILATFARRHADWPDIIGFKRVDGLLLPTNVASYGAMENTEKGRTEPFSRIALCFVGWVNGDKTLFAPPRRKERNDLGDEVEVPADRIRREMEDAWLKAWNEWITTDDAILNALEDSFNRRLRGYIPPAYSSAPIDIARWGVKVALHDYQNEAATKLLANRSGLLALDVGLGKTFTGIAVIARARQEGWARRPVVVVPNTIAFKWVRDFTTCLPDYRAVVIGANRFRVRRATGRRITEEEAARLDADLLPGQSKVWRWKSERDTPAERAKKWTDFQAGLYDVAVVTMSAFARQQIDRAFVERFVADNIAIRRAITLSLDQAEAEKAEKGEKSEGGEKKPAKKRTERQEADTHERVRAWVGAKLAAPKDWQYDPGIDWHALGIDLILVDEGQNYKNLFYSSREGSPERTASKRSWAMAFRCASVREHSGGAGVVILSATPMKNAAAEFFNMLFLVNPAIWAQVGLGDPEGFVNLFADINDQLVTQGDGVRKKMQVVTGFHHLEALKGVVYRWSTFKTAQQVGLKIPAVKRTMHIANPTDAQQQMFGRLFGELFEISEKIKKVAQAAKGNPSFLGALRALREKKQGIHARMYLAAVHPGLLEGGDQTPSAGPKLVQCADEIAATRPQVCAVEKDGTRIWSEQACDTDGDPLSPRGCAIEMADSTCLDCAHIVFCDNVRVHTWLKQLLVERGIPAERIAILNAEEAPDLELRQQIADGFNGSGLPTDEDYEPPRFDVVIANAVAYEGIDLQRHTCAIHHLDVPYEPATLQQRNGRGVRQGNLFGKVTLNFYFVKGSSEKHRLDKIERKRGIMVSLFEEGAVSTNTVQADTVEGDEDAQDAFIEYCPAELREALETGAEDERREMEEERRQKARLSANRTLGEAVQAARRLRRARESDDSDRVPRLLQDLDLKDRELGMFGGTGLWRYSWLTVARAALEEPRVLVAEVGPAMFPGVRLAVEQPGEEEPLRFVVTHIDGDLSAAWLIQETSPTPRRFPVAALNSELGKYEVLAASAIPPRAEWYAETFPSFVPSFEEHRWNATLAPYGEVFAGVLWPRILTGLGSSTVKWRYPYADGQQLAIEAGADWRQLRGTALPPTSEGWATFLGMVRAQRRLKFTELNAAAEAWWGRSLPLGSVGADLVPEAPAGGQVLMFEGRA